MPALGYPCRPQPPSGETAPASASTHWQDSVLHIFPENIAKSVAEGQILQVAVFAIFFGISLACVSREKREPMLSFFSSLAEVMFKFTNVVMYFAPIGVGAAMAFTVGQMGIGVLLNLGKLLVTLVHCVDRFRPAGAAAFRFALPRAVAPLSLGSH